MSEQINAYCTVCGNGYHLCLSCKDKMKLQPWKAFTDTAEHYKIHQIIHGFSTKVYTKDEVRSKLKNVDLSDLETFKPNIKAIIKDVLKEESIEPSVQMDVPVASRKKNYKVNKVEVNENTNSDIVKNIAAKIE